MTRLKGNFQAPRRIGLWAILLLPSFVAAQTNQEALDALTAAQNAYFDGVYAGKAKTPADREKLERETIGAATLNLQKVGDENAVKWTPPVLSGEKNQATKTAPGMPAKRANKYAPVSESTPEPEVRVEGPEVKTLLDFRKGGINPTSAPSPVATPSAPSGKGGVTILQFPGASEPAAVPSARPRKK